MTPSVSDLLGKRVLVGLTCVDPDEDVLDKLQTHGVVVEAREDAILLVRDDGSSFGLPPVYDLLVHAEPGVYTLHETGESIENPDFLASLRITINNPTNLAAIRTRGFEPPDPGQAS